MPHVLILCTANICRSPMAHGLMRSYLDAAGYADWVVSSGGTWARDGMEASEFSLQLLAEHGIDMGGHRSRALTDAMLEEAALVLVMTRDHKEAVQTEFSDFAEKVYLISEMVGERFDIGDPIGGPIEAYRDTYDELEDIIRRGLARIVALATGNG